MKVERLKKEENFEPIVLTLTIETKEDLEALTRMCDYNISIPKMVKGRQIEIETFLNSLSKQLKNESNSNLAK